MHKNLFFQIAIKESILNIQQSYERAMVRTIRIVGALTTGLKVSK